MTETESRYKKIYKMVEQIPYGQVATYGQIARLVGLPRHARMVGYALYALPNDNEVPWQRVVNAKGEVSPRATPQYEDLQRHLLEREGVVFNDAGRISLKTYQWKRL